MKQYYIIFLLLPIFARADWLQQTTFKVGTGPGWFKTQTDERFTATSDGSPGALQTLTDNNLGPWIDGAVRMQFCDYMVAEAYAGGGWVRKGYGKQITKVLSVDLASVAKFFDLDARVNGDIALVYLGVGPHWKISNRYAMSATIGYAYNREKWHYTMIARPETSCQKDTWQAGYIGVDTSLQICDCLAVDFYYKWLIGKAKSNLTQTIGGITAPDNRSRPLFFGNILALTSRYQISDCWQTGLTAMYTYLQNMHRGCCVRPVNSNVVNNYLEHMRFNMLTITGFIEYVY